GSPAKGVWGQKLHRGFESLSLRQFCRCKGLTGPGRVRTIPLLFFAPVAQLDRAPGYELGGRRFESFRARHEVERASGHPLALSFCASRDRGYRVSTWISLRTSRTPLHAIAMSSAR